MEVIEGVQCLLQKTHEEAVEQLRYTRHAPCTHSQNTIKSRRGVVSLYS